MKKALLIIGGVILFILVAIVTLPYLFRGTIETKIKETINTSINAKVDWKSLDLSLIKNFPNFEVELQQLSVINKAPFEGDTLAYINAFTLVVDIKSVLFGDQIGVIAVVLNQPLVDAKFNKEGKANWDIVIPSTDTIPETPVDTTASAPLKVKLDKIAIENGNIRFSDESMALKTIIGGFNLAMSGNMDADVTEIKFDSSIDGLTVSMDSATYFKNTKIAVSSTLEANLATMVFKFKEGLLTINKLPLTIDGSFGMPAEGGYDLDMQIAALKSDFKTFLGIVPPAYLKDLETIKTTGEMALNVNLKGRYVDENHLPAFDLGLKIINATLQYPDLPKSLKAININLGVANPGTNLDATTVDLSQFHFEMASNPFDLKAKVKTPISNATFDMAAKGVIDLGSLKDVIPMDSFDITGIINADLAVAGDNNMIEKELYDQINAKGDVQLKKFFFKSKDLPQGVTIEQAQLKFTPKELELVSFKSVIGKSDFGLTGKIQNYLGYALKNEVLVGQLNHTSALIDANEFISGEPTTAATPTTPTPADTTASEPIEIPRNIDFTLNSSTKKIYYDKLTIENCAGQITIKDGVAKMNNLKMDMLDGSAILGGIFNTQEPKKPSVNFNVNATNININKAANSFAIVDTLAPIAKNTNGFVSAIFNIDMLLGADLSPIMNTVNGKGNVKSADVTLKGAKFQKNLASMLNDSKYEEMKMQNFNFNFTVTNGNVILEPFKVTSMGKTLTIQGTTSVDQKIDYRINVPVSRKEISKIAGVAGLSMSSDGADIPVDFLIGGQMTNPTFKLDASSYKNQATKEAKEAVKKEATKIIENVVADPTKSKETIEKETKQLKDKFKGLLK